MTSEKKETKKFLVPVTWVVAAEVVIEAESEEEAINKYHCGDGTGHPEFVEFLSIEEEDTLTD